jgi:hypothetical protein
LYHSKDDVTLKINIDLMIVILNDLARQKKTCWRVFFFFVVVILNDLACQNNKKKKTLIW